MSTAINHAKRPAPGIASKETEPKAKHDYVAIVGRIASAFSIVMYVSYIAQIANNLDGHPGAWVQPLAAVFNCGFWAAYGFMKTPKDWPIIVANVPGIFLALITVITAFVH